MVRFAERIMKFFRKKKTRIKSTEWQPSHLNVPEDILAKRGRIRTTNQDKIINLLQNDVKNSPRRAFSNYPPLPAIGTQSISYSKKRPVLLRQATYTVMHPILVRGPNDLNESKLHKKEVTKNKHNKDRKTLQNIKNKYKDEAKFDIDVTKNTGSAFWFAVWSVVN